MQNKFEKKALKRQKKFQNILLRECGINHSKFITKHLMVGNAGLATRLEEDHLLKACLIYGPVDQIVMLPGKTYCFVTFHDESGANCAYEAMHSKINPISNDPKTLYLVYTERVPVLKSAITYNWRPPGLILLEDFVTEQEEESLLNCVDWSHTEHILGQSLKLRKVKHFGYEFHYDINNVHKDSPLTQNIPEECSILLPRLKERNCNVMSLPPDQLTVNQYQPGQGIPSHVDTHSAFEDPILSLSLGAPVVMEFKYQEGRNVPVYLPQRSLLIMSGESRYLWSHGISPRKTDIVPTPCGTLTVHNRGIRTSFTFRRVRRGECDCNYYDQCDSYQRNKTLSGRNSESNKIAAELEAHHVLQVYEEIADHFSDTRHKPWPNVLSFVQSLPPGALLVDVGCGNGKYFGHNSTIYEVGCDSSFGLAQVCRERGFQVFNCNCLALPLRSGIADGCISIAVIHHLATKERRSRALREIVRTLRFGGKALIYVWAKDQERHKNKSAYLKQERKNRRAEVLEGFQNNNQPSCAKELSCVINKTDTTLENAACSKRTNIDPDNSSNIYSGNPANLLFPSIPIHTNRTQFQHQDVLVPWKLKPVKECKSDEKVQTFYRFYHVFEEGELEQLCHDIPECQITKSYYDQGNWCIVVEKIKIENVKLDDRPC